MKFTLEIGDKEKAKLEFSRNAFTGAMETMVNGERVAMQSPWSPFTHFSLRTKRRYEFPVGKTESHRVVLEKERPWLFAGFRPHTYRVFVDGQMIHEQTGY